MYGVTSFREPSLTGLTHDSFSARMMRPFKRPSPRLHRRRQTRPMTAVPVYTRLLSSGSLLHSSSRGTQLSIARAASIANNLRGPMAKTLRTKTMRRTT